MPAFASPDQGHQGRRRRVRSEPALFRLRSRQCVQAGRNGHEPRRGILGVGKRHPAARHRRRRRVPRRRSPPRCGRRHIGSKPVGLPTHILIANLNWKTPIERVGARYGGHRIAGARRRRPTMSVHAAAGAGRYWRPLSFQDRQAQRDLPPAAGQPVRQSRLGARRFGCLHSNPGRYVQGYLAVDL